MNLRQLLSGGVESSSAKGVSVPSRIVRPGRVGIRREVGYNFALMDPNGLCISRSWNRKTLEDRAKMLQEAFDLGRHYEHVRLLHADSLED